MSLSGNCTCSHCYAQIRDSPRSWCEQGFLKIQVTGNQKVSGAPDDLLQLTAISQLGGFMMGLQTPCSVGCVSWGSRHHQLAFCVLWKSKKKAELIVLEISFLCQVSIHFVPPWLQFHLCFLGQFALTLFVICAALLLSWSATPVLQVLFSGKT